MSKLHPDQVYKHLEIMGIEPKIIDPTVYQYTVPAHMSAIEFAGVLSAKLAEISSAPVVQTISGTVSVPSLSDIAGKNIVMVSNKNAHDSVFEQGVTALYQHMPMDTRAFLVFTEQDSSVQQPEQPLGTPNANLIGAMPGMENLGRGLYNYTVCPTRDKHRIALDMGKILIGNGSVFVFGDNVPDVLSSLRGATRDYVILVFTRGVIPEAQSFVYSAMNSVRTSNGVVVVIQ